MYIFYGVYCISKEYILNKHHMHYQYNIILVYHFVLTNSEIKLTEIKINVSGPLIHQ